MRQKKIEANSNEQQQHPVGAPTTPATTTIKGKPQKGSIQLESPLVFYILAKVPSATLCSVFETSVMEQFCPCELQATDNLCRQNLS